ncbi:nucleotide-binding domain-containing protein [Curtanaerobium respiraculi]|uniref:nucleotide-binding domain-containing protein n=1 Tax=Curtanaerobium respiraculi TaxID=2949669 RepID=UPI0024B3A2EC|nr:hypothetical protein [Curtanaerobium respiraculi]
MSDSQYLLEQVLANLKVANSDEIANRRDAITKALNKSFRDNPDSTKNSMMIGSYGRHTAINGISDLDMVYILPAGLQNQYRGKGGTSKALRDVREAIESRYSSTDVTVSSPVVVVKFANFQFEVQPVFSEGDGTFKYPDTKLDIWKPIKPRKEIEAIKQLDEQSHGTLRKVCRLARAWKDKHAVKMNGLLIDTLAYNYLSCNEQLWTSGVLLADCMFGFFAYLASEPQKEYYLAPGSNQKVYVKNGFRHKAAIARNLCQEAIDGEGNTTNWRKWRAVFGKVVSSQTQISSEEESDYIDTEEFIEDLYPQNIRYGLDIDCEVGNAGTFASWLSSMLRSHVLLPREKTLLFKVTYCSVPEPYELKWKVLNRGDEARRRDMIRGQIIDDGGNGEQKETTDFKGDHYVECYAVKDGEVVARAHIDVPIS